MELTKSEKNEILDVYNKYRNHPSKAVQAAIRDLSRGNYTINELWIARTIPDLAK